MECDDMTRELERGSFDPIRPLELPKFEDRWTLAFRFQYDALAERIWRAITTADELNIWFLPICRVDPKVGGKAKFTWGMPESAMPDDWTISEFEPMKAVQYSVVSRPQQRLRFELESKGATTSLRFVQGFPRGFVADWATPAAPKTPWVADTVAGMHLMLDALGRFVAGNWAAAEIQAESARLVKLTTSWSLNPVNIPGRERLHEIYEKHLRETCPSA